ncbi:MAG: Hpt domain-containing protein, partial [Pseudomonadota bacterium]
METIRAGFFEECAELMEGLEAGLLALENGVSDPDTVDSVFRAVHSIKGGAAAFAMTDLVAFSHDFETLLDGLRCDRIDPTPDLIALLLRAADRLSDIIALTRDDLPVQDRFDDWNEYLQLLEAAEAGEPAPSAVESSHDSTALWMTHEGEAILEENHPA